MSFFRRTKREPPVSQPTVDRNSTVVKQLQSLVRELEDIDRDLQSTIAKGKRPDGG